MYKSVAMIGGHFSMCHFWGRWHILYFNSHVFGKWGHGIVKYLKLRQLYGGANLYGLPLVRSFHLLTAIFKRAELRSFENDLFILSSKQYSEGALLEPQTWRVF